jgi:hypothetical protein
MAPDLPRKMFFCYSTLPYNGTHHRIPCRRLCGLQIDFLPFHKAAHRLCNGAFSRGVDGLLPRPEPLPPPCTHPLWSNPYRLAIEPTGRSAPRGPRPYHRGWVRPDRQLRSPAKPILTNGLPGQLNPPLHTPPGTSSPSQSQLRKLTFSSQEFRKNLPGINRLLGGKPSTGNKTIQEVVSKPFL